MSEDNAITSVGQAGDAASKDPVEGSVASGEDAAGTGSGESSASDAGTSGGSDDATQDAGPASSQEPAEGRA